MLQIDKILQMDFENTEMPVLFAQPRQKASYWLTAEDYRNKPDNITDIDKLRSELSEIFDSRFQNYAQFEAKCDIKRDTFQKMMRYRNGRNITYRTLSKIVIGAALSVEKATELFALTGTPLNPEKNLYDYILLCELKNGCDINEFDSDLQKFGLLSIFSKAD